jgi:hypothetical protein
MISVWDAWAVQTQRIVSLVYVAEHSLFHWLYTFFPTEDVRTVSLPLAQGECSGTPLRVEHPDLGSVLVYHTDAERAVRAHFGEDEGDVWMTPNWENP